MKFLTSQFDELELGDWELSPLNLPEDKIDDKEFILNIFNWLPSHIQGLCVAWGSSDTEFREKSITYIIEKQEGTNYDEFFDSGKIMNFDFNIKAD